jgi:Trk-type K+ transport system membrane component
MSEATLAASAVEPSPPVAVPAFGRVLLAFVGLLALGVSAGLGTSSVEALGRFAPAALVVGAGAVLLSSPPLLVAHQLLQLQARPDALGAVLARGVVRLGQLAAGLVPLLLWFAATSGLAPFLAPLALYGAGVFALGSTAMELVAAEVATGERDLARASRMGLLVTGWCGLVSLVALRLSVDVARFILNF